MKKSLVKTRFSFFFFYFLFISLIVIFESFASEVIEDLEKESASERRGLLNSRIKDGSHSKIGEEKQDSSVFSSVPAQGFTERLFLDSLGQTLRCPAVALVTLEITQENFEKACRLRDERFRGVSERGREDVSSFMCADTSSFASRIQITPQTTSVLVFSNFEDPENTYQKFLDERFGFADIVSRVGSRFGLSSGFVAAITERVGVTSERVERTVRDHPELIWSKVICDLACFNSYDRYKASMLYNNQPVAYSLFSIQGKETFQDPEIAVTAALSPTTNLLQANIERTIGRDQQTKNVLFRLDKSCLDALHDTGCVITYITWRVRESYFLKSRKHASQYTIYDWGANFFTPLNGLIDPFEGTSQNSAIFAADVLEDLCEIHPLHVDPFVSNYDSLSLAVTSVAANFDPTYEG